jgi:2-polyprenyl-6-methoxyphenol hydroxylase-like FAD-dependent oxidoreductase
MNMKVAVLGAGPAGLYFAYRFKRARPEAVVDVFEQNAADATWGFGVVFSDRALEFLAADDPETVAFITPAMETWRDITLVHRGEAIAIDGVGFSAIGRLALLQLLQQRVRSVGLEPRFGEPVRSLDELTGYDLVVAADGVNSLVRRSHEGDFKVSQSYLDNKFAWFGTTKRFETLTQTFIATELGNFNAHHYRYQPGMSTFIVECDRATWLRCGFHTRSTAEAAKICEGVFADTLEGHPLVSNRSIWRNFPWIWCDRWSFRNMVLVGDALRTAHFSIGSGTRLAIEDTIALLQALQDEPADIPAALARYEAIRRPSVERLVAAARASAQWYESFAEHMRLAPVDLAYSYINRAGRLDESTLRRMAPRFMSRVDAAGGRSP